MEVYWHQHGIYSLSKKKKVLHYYTDGQTYRSFATRGSQLKIWHF